MQNEITLLFAVVFCLLVIITRPVYALCVYFLSLLWYPNYMMVSFGTIDVSLSRFVVGVLFLRCIFDGRIRSKFVWMYLDTLVALSMAVYVVTICIVEPLSTSVENRGGFLMDTWFAYMVVRYIITDIARLQTVIKCVGIALVPLAFLGIIESVTGWSPYALICGKSLYFNYVTHYGARWGLNRGVGPFSHSILFGCAFAMFLPLVYYLRNEKGNWGTGAYILSGITLLGALSSMSSSPWVMVIAVIFCLAMEKRKYLVKPVLISLVFLCIFIAIASNRPFYHVVASYANPLGGSGWHRAKLIDCAIEHFDEWWLVGYGDKDPGWGPSLGMSKTDVTNEFILAGVRYGILGIIALCIVLAATFFGLLSAYRKTTEPKLRSLYWSLGCVLSSVIVTWLSVSFFGQLMPLFYCVLGIIGSSFDFVSDDMIIVKGRLSDIPKFATNNGLSLGIGTTELRYIQVRRWKLSVNKTLRTTWK